MWLVEERMVAWSLASGCARFSAVTERVSIGRRIS